MTKQEIKDLVIDAFKKLPNVDGEIFENGINDNLFTDFGLNSLDFVEALMTIEQEISRRTKEKFTIADEFADNPNLTLAMIINYVYDRVNK